LDNRCAAAFWSSAPLNRDEVVIKTSLIYDLLNTHEFDWPGI
jgi:hypothetical protein